MTTLQKTEPVRQKGRERWPVFEALSRSGIERIGVSLSIFLWLVNGEVCERWERDELDMEIGVTTCKYLESMAMLENWTSWRTLLGTLLGNYLRIYHCHFLKVYSFCETCKNRKDEFCLSNSGAWQDFSRGGGSHTVSKWGYSTDSHVVFATCCRLFSYKRLTKGGVTGTPGSP